MATHYVLIVGDHKYELRGVSAWRDRSQIQYSASEAIVQPQGLHSAFLTTPDRPSQDVRYDLLLIRWMDQSHEQIDRIFSELGGKGKNRMFLRVGKVGNRQHFPGTVREQFVTKDMRASNGAGSNMIAWIHCDMHKKRRSFERGKRGIGWTENIEIMACCRLGEKICRQYPKLPLALLSISSPHNRAFNFDIRKTSANPSACRRFQPSSFQKLFKSLMTRRQTSGMDGCMSHSPGYPSLSQHPIPLQLETPWYYTRSLSH